MDPEPELFGYTFNQVAVKNNGILSKGGREVLLVVVLFRSSLQELISGLG